MGTRDFRVEIGPLGASGYEVCLTTPDGGAMTTVMQLPLSASELQALAQRLPDAVLASSVAVRRSISGDEHPVQQMGGMLFDALLAEGGRGLFAACRDQADREGAQLRLVLRIRPPELNCLPWEYLYDSRDEDYVCLNTSLIRHPYVQAAVREKQVVAPLRILCMTSRAGDQQTLATADEQRRLRDTLSTLERDGRIELGWVKGGTWRDLRDAMERGPWHIFHFSGHGGFDQATQEGTLALADEDGRTFHIGADNLAMLLRAHSSLRLVLLNACEGGRAAALDPFSSVAGALMRRGIPAVLAMQYQISDGAALEFSRTFYEYLADQFPVELCVRQARQAIRLAFRGSMEWGTPVLYMRSADGMLFQAGGDAERTSRSAPAPGGDRHDREPTPVPPPTRSTGPAVAHRIGPGRKLPTVRDRLVVSGREAAEAVLRAKARRSVAPTAPPSAVGALLTTLSLAETVHSVTFSPDSGQLAMGCDRHVALVTDLAGRRKLKVRHGSWDQSVRDIAFDQSGRRLATAGDDGLVRVWDISSGDRLLKLMHDKAVLSVAYSHDGLRLVTGSADGSARVWDATTGERLLKVTLDQRIAGVAFSPDGRRFATASWDRSARVWDAGTGRRQLEVTHGKEVMSVAFSPDGSLLATASWDRTACLWDTGTGRREREVRPGDQVWSVAFSPDGRLLATGSHDATARVWDCRTGREMFSAAHTAAVCCVAFSPDGRMLATGSLDATVRLFRCGD